MTGRESIVDLRGNVEGECILAVIARRARLAQQQLVPAFGIDRTVLQRGTAAEHLARERPIAGIDQPPGALRDIARIGHRLGAERSGERIGIGQVLEHGEPRREHRAPCWGDIAELLLGIGRGLRPEQRIHPRVMIGSGKVRGKAAEQHCLVFGHHRAAAPGGDRDRARGIALPHRVERHRIARAADIGERRKAVEIGDHLLRRGGACAQRLLGIAAHLVLVGPAGVGDQEARKGREGVIVGRGGQRAPVGDRARHVGRHRLEQVGARAVPVAAIAAAARHGGIIGGLVAGETGGRDAQQGQGEQHGGAPRNSNS